MTTEKRQSKAGFLRELFREDPGLTHAEANQAWSAAGYEGEIGESSFYNAKTEYNKQAAGGAGVGTGPGRRGPKVGRGPATKRTTGPAATTTNGQEPVVATAPRAQPSRGTENRERVLVEAEADIDELILKLRDQDGLPEVLEALRRARRLLARQHEA
ncbi:hypothetical protein [Tautonia plasticadhaerens]|uniref:Uncharacterized protein n=1 Tax=Tautonia plasticadhaerens TaxID=2527974 RepID=A0A518H9P7_9BACT|nr:hypothetical protein [Tautonia plasticadhaerens]QDV37578.1 hypothetical protein ElP_55180 [Tautonia plasticadhaerens]